MNNYSRNMDLDILTLSKFKGLKKLFLQFKLGKNYYI